MAVHIVSVQWLQASLSGAAVQTSPQPSISLPSVQDFIGKMDFWLLGSTRPVDAYRALSMWHLGDPEIVTAVDAIVAQADTKYLTMELPAVLQKLKVPPSGSKHDFVRQLLKTIFQCS